jgi:uncharacterized protein YwgA
LSDVNDFALLLCVFRDSGGFIEGRKRLQKIVCTMKYKNKIPFSFDFRPYFYGPYSEELAEIVDTLVGTGLLKEWPEPLGEDVVKYTYELSNKGKELATRTERALDKKLLTKIQESSEEMKGLSTSELVSLSKKVFGY